MASRTSKDLFVLNKLRAKKGRRKEKMKKKRRFVRKVYGRKEICHKET